MTLRFALIVLCCVALLGVAPTNAELPYKAEGLSKEQAAAYLLERFAFGARPGEVEKVAQMGPEKWLAQQLAGNLPETELDKRLEAFPALKLTQAEMQAIYVQNGRIRRILQREGVIDAAKMDRKEMNKKISAYRKKHGLRAYNALYNQELRGQKVMRAVYSENQLTEVLTDFWFNHFNVTTRDGGARSHVLSYERDAIRPNVLGKFRVILGATAKHPAMLYYLDNIQSRMAPPSERNQPRPKQEMASGEMGMDGGMDGGMMGGEAKAPAKAQTPTFRKTNGDIAAVMGTLAQSPEFWAEAKKRSKMKSPFELVVSSLRALEADVKNPQPMMQWFNRMGEPLYGYVPPTGFPDYAESWANAGTLIARMNFGVRLATGRINGVILKRLPKESDRTPTTEEALAMYSKLLLPAQDTSAIASEVKKMIPADAKRKDIQVVSMLIGSPEFQYR